MNDDSPVTVALIVIPDFEVLSHLVAKMPVWAVDVAEHRIPVNLPNPRRFRDWLTLYTKSENIDLEQECLNQIGSIEEHYPNVAEIVFVGLNESTRLSNDLLSFGFNLDESGGLPVARKQALPNLNNHP